MFPVQVEFPKFVADQLLTSDDLNQLFGYLDEQNRMTRTNLVGIGIVCGLHLQINNAKTEVTITKGCGVTSAGYLISVDEIGYSQYKSYKVDTPLVYDKFYKTDGGGNKVAMNVWELRQPALDPDLAAIDEGFLKDKVILLSVELKEENNKNCNPDSCDDKGINVTVSFLPMAVHIDDAKLLMGTTAGSFGINTYIALPELRMKRWDVPNTSPVYTRDIFEAYTRLLDKNFIGRVEATLKNMYTVFGTIAASGYSTNPFTGLAAKFEFLYNGGISLNQLIHLQYYYDLFSDLLLAYQEFRKAGTHLLSTCCPDSSLFPRHLLLGEAVPSVSSGLLPYRHYFIYSPLFDQQNMVAELKSLFNRLVLMIGQFFLPPVSGNNTKEDNFLRITPSMLWDVPLSNKAIPYYYQVNSGSQPLFLSWDYRRTLLNDAKRNLSYHAGEYNNSDDFVTSPLNFDLEPYNFLRVEGIVGKSYVHVLKQVKQQVVKNRLPVDIIALNTDAGIRPVVQFNAANRVDVSGSAMEMLCHFQDLESMYDSMRREILCTLCKELKYYYDLRFSLLQSLIKKMDLAGQPSQVDLLTVCSKNYIIKTKSLGITIEFLYRKGLTDETLTIESLFEAFDIDVTDTNNDDIPDGLNVQMTTIFLALVNFFKVPLGIIRLSTLLTEDLAAFDAKAYCAATEKLGEYAKSVKAIFNIVAAGQQKDATVSGQLKDGSQPANTDSAGTARATSFSSNAMLANLSTNGNVIAAILLIILMIEDLMDHLDVFIYHCKCGALLSLKEDYMKRYGMLTRLRQFGFFTKMHPGIQHKAGVPMGGTFIIVYHARKGRTIKDGFTNNTRFREAVDSDQSKGTGGNKLFIANRQSVQRPTNAFGFIIDEDNNPVAGATVTVAETGEGTITSANGSFKFVSSIVPYTLLVEAVGYEDYEEIKTDDDGNILVRLTPAKGDILDALQPGIVIADFYLPYRCCSDCPPVQYIINDVVAPPTPNQGPRADAGADQVITLPANSVTLNGSGSTDPDGSIVAFQWIKLSGPSQPPPAIITAASTQTDVKDLAEGAYIFELTVTDDKGSIARDTVQVTVNAAPPPPNKPPVADAGADSTIVLSGTNDSLILDGSNSKDDDGVIVGFKWNQVNGPAVTIVSPTLVQTVVTGLQPGVFEFELIVTDNDNASASDKVMITVAPPANLPPKADAGSNQVVTITQNNNIATLNGSNSKDPEGAALVFNWKNLGGPNAPVITDPSKAITTVTGLIAGDYKFELTVTDDKGDSDSATVAVQVIFRDTPPVTCGPLPDVVAPFAQLEGSVSAATFNMFKDFFGFYDEAEEYFKILKSIENEVTAKHLDFFSSLFNNQATPALIIKWISRLQQIIVERKDLRLLALRFYRILVNLSMYIVCIQKEDFDVAKIPMNRVFSVIQSNVKQWVDMIATGIFSPEEIAMVKNMGADIENEIARATQNGQAAVKVKWLGILSIILKMIKSIA